MDDFTKRMLERAKSRREKLDTALASVGDNKRRRAPLAENNPAPATPSAVDDLKKDGSGDAPYSKMEMDLDEVSSSAPNSALQNRLNRLGRLYTEPENLEQYSSPVHPRTETLSRFPASEPPVPKAQTHARKARLDALAQNFKDWEDDYSKLPPTPYAPDQQRQLSPVRIGRAASPQRARFGSPVRAPSPVRAASPQPKVLFGSPVRAPSPVRAASPVRNMGASSPVRAASPIPISPLATPSSFRTPQMGFKSSAVKNVVLDKSIIATLNPQEDEDEEESFVSSAPTPTSGSVSSPGWVYRAGSPVKPRMGVGSPVRAASPIRHVSPVRAASPVRPMSPVRPCSPVGRPKNMSPGSVLQKAAMFESAAVAASASPAIDPANLPLSQRMALFEKNKTNAPLLPKVAFSTPLPAKLIPSAPTVPAKVEPKPKVQAAPVKKPAESQEKDNLVQAHKAMFEKSLNQIAKPSEVVASSQSERQKELEMLRSRWDKQKQMSNKEEPEEKDEVQVPPPPPPAQIRQKSRSPSPSKRAESPKKQYPSLDVRKIKVSPPKEGRIYPSLSDIDATESEMDADTSGSTDQSDEVSSEANHSFGEEILKAAGLNNERNSVKRVASKMTENECAVLEDMDDFLDEALGNISEIASVGPTPPKKSRDKEEYVFRTPAAKFIPSAPDTPIPSVLVDEGNVKPLTHTVSFYRKQQSQGSKLSTPVHHVYRQPEEVVEEETDPRETARKMQKKIKSLEEEVSRQQTVISQASQALNLCRSTVEFSNSSEQVEAERLLLLATHKRQALLNEIQRLKVEGDEENDLDVHSETGSLAISNLCLPLKREFLSRMRREENLEQYIVCLVKSQEQVLASPMLPTSSVPPKQELVRFPGTLTLEKLKSNFAVTLEVYTLQARRETISHEDKYHIKKDTPKLRLTPKKQKNDSLLVMPVIQSPAGPNAVRSPSFSLAGFTVFSLRELSRTQFTLNKVPYNSPLEGHICLEMSSELLLDTEQRGFLTMFDDISGFGAWHRRWCVLDGARLAYWKYPDDEKKREPIGWIDLSECSSKQITAVSREICARLNTFLIETQRPACPDDKESLVMIPGKNVTTIRHLISTDSKEERIQWCKELNHAVTSMRAWKSCHKTAGKGAAV
ncbi:anillin-like isoform X2 [Neocloeon triangulifer]|uniref:anillin-like isoform X2 n=1 Tax=Neocloeon triangulifer TaxID=2078957 RepID=UPI00286F0D8F|nr:anillin-like isoform X2 [Neocloeon triangulifer]